MPQPLLLLLSVLPAEATHFETIRLRSDFLCEGASYGDFNKDGKGDVVIGPYWYEGPDFQKAHTIYEQEAFDPKGYSNNFFAWPRDFDGDGWLDVLFVGFPGKEAYWYENPRGKEELWARHLVHEVVDNESPAYADLTGDGREELVFQTDGYLGWAGPDPKDVRAPWVFHRLSEKMDLGRFTHGLGVGDIDGDGRMDVMLKDRWWRQPESLAGDPVWASEEAPFAPGQGGAQMYAYDVDGDGDNDVITSLEAHGFGLVWLEQVVTDGKREFRPHTILGASPEDSPYGLRIGELHAIDLCDMNGDGALDIVTGKRWWSHGAQGDPELGAPAVIYWFELQRRPRQGIAWVPHLVDDDSGVGVQIVAGDIDGDGLPDVVSGNKKGSFVHLQRVGKEEQDPRPVEKGSDPRQPPGFAPLTEDGTPGNYDFENGTLSDWTATGDAFDGQPVEGDRVGLRRSDMHSEQVGRYWVGTFEQKGDAPRGTLESRSFRVDHPYLSFWVAGGRTEATRVEVRRTRDRSLLATASGEDDEALRPVVVDLGMELGELVYVRLVDDSSGGWGHVNFDHLRLHDEPPVFQGVQPILPFDVVPNAGLAPAEAVAAMTVPQGFQVELIVAEPDLHQPVAFTIDERGRIWVVEAFSYPTKRPEGEGLDRILILEDADHDGRFERQQVFTAGLNLVSGIEVGFGGVWVGAAPELLFIPDRDHDDVPDGPPEVLLDGWGYHDTHETLNAFNWGPDGWLYGCHGVFTHSLVGKPGCKDEERVPINAGIWRYHPLRHEFEVFAWGTSNPWGVDFDDHGQAFATACVIPHLYHVIQGGRYIRQAGEHFDPFAYIEIQTMADHLHYLGGWSHAGNGRSNQVGGGHAHCGAMVYLGDRFPEQYRNTVFFNNIHGNRVNNDIPERQGSGFTGHHGADFLLANDRWYRGVNLKYGPDGAVYLIDWYDKQACHTTDTGIWDRTNGRLYRVSYGPYRPVPVDFRRVETDELVDLQLHRNDWFVRTARRMLEEQGIDERARRKLETMMRENPDDDRRLRAMWALHVTGELDQRGLLGALEDQSEYVRAWAVQLLLEPKHPAAVVLGMLADLAQRDPSPLVRLYLASALQRMPVEERWEIARALLARAEDAGDQNLPTLIWYGIEPLVLDNPHRALQMARAAAMPQLAGFLWRRAASDPALHDEIVAQLGQMPDDEKRYLAVEQVYAALEGLSGLPAPKEWARAYKSLSQSADERVRDRALLLSAVFGESAAFPALRQLLEDAGQPLAKRKLALGALAGGKEVETAELLQRLLDDPELGGEALRALAGFDHAGTPDAVLAHYPGYSPTLRQDALATLASRAVWGRELLAAVARGVIQKSELSATVLRQLSALADSEVDALLAEVWGVLHTTPEEKLAAIARWKEHLSPELLGQADKSFGREVFGKTCMRCHTLFGEGGQVGPDITGANRSDLGYLLENVVSPNALIPSEYQVTVVETEDGRLVTGIQKGSDDQVLRLRTENDLVIVPRDEIASMRLDSLSMMPEGQLETLKEEEIVALFAYLQSATQVPRKLLPENRAELFDGKSLAGWMGDAELWSVENGEIVGRSAEPLAANHFLVSQFLVSDFRLEVDVLLTPNEANSGIQFRSLPREGGEVEGYQADIGAGWWGKLYEELGRGILWEQSGEANVRPLEWNHYVVQARGDHIQTWINGVGCVDYHDAAGRRQGQIAFQLHSGAPLSVRFKNLSVEPLDHVLH